MNETVPDDILETRIVMMPFGTRAYRALAALGIEKLGDIVGLDQVELRRVDGIGNKTIAEIKEVLRDYGVYVMGETPPLSAAEKAEAIIQFARVVQMMTKDDIENILLRR